MDAVDREIISELRADARLPYRTLGARVGLSANAAADRVRRLRRAGVIRGFTAVVDEAAAGGGRLDVLVEVRLRPTADPAAFESALARLPAVREALHVTGGWDYQLRVSVADAAAIDAFVRALKRDAGAEQTSTRLVLGRPVSRPG